MLASLRTPRSPSSGDTDTTTGPDGFSGGAGTGPPGSLGRAGKGSCPSIGRSIPGTSAGSSGGAGASGSSGTASGSSGTSAGGAVSFDAGNTSSGNRSPLSAPQPLTRATNSALRQDGQRLPSRLRLGGASDFFIGVFASSRGVTESCSTAYQPKPATSKLARDVSDRARCVMSR